MPLSPVDSDFLSIGWYTADPSDFFDVNSPFLDLEWAISANINSPGLSLTWSIRYVYSSFSFKSSTFGTLVTGFIAPVFVGKRIAYGDLPQVFRCRSIYNLNHIVYESPAENLADGYMILSPSNDSLTDRSLITLTYYDRSIVLAQTGEDVKKIAAIEFPCKVYQEYQNTTDIRYAIRYLGIIERDPYKSSNTSPRRDRISDLVFSQGATCSEVNRTGVPVTFIFTLSNGKKFSGILPVNHALAFIKTGDTTFKCGHVTANVLTFGPPGGGIPVDNIIQNFISFDGS